MMNTKQFLSVNQVAEEESYNVHSLISITELVHTHNNIIIEIAQLQEIPRLQRRTTTTKNDTKCPEGNTLKRHLNVFGSSLLRNKFLDVPLGPIHTDS